MNEPTPERHLFLPTERYRANIEMLLDALLQVTEDQPVSERLEIPSAIQQRSWAKGGAYFAATLFDAPSELGSRRPHVSLMRANLPIDGELYEVRTYRYTRGTGEMQVINSLFTTEEIMTQRLDSIEAQLYQQGINEGLSQHVFSASEVDYADFLADLSGFLEPL